MELNQYLDIFIEETREHLDVLNTSLLRLEKKPDNIEDINEIFRAAHTIKGMSGTMGYKKIAELTHAMEDVLDLVRNKELSITENIITDLFKCFDALENYLDNIVKTNKEGDSEHVSLIETLKKNTIKKDEKKLDNKIIIDIDESSIESSIKLNNYDKGVIKKANEIGMDTYSIFIQLNKGCVLKSARSFVIFQAIEKHGDIIKSEPSVEDIEDENFDFEFTLVLVTKHNKEKLDDTLKRIAEVEKVIINKINYQSIDEASTKAVKSEEKSKDNADKAEPVKKQNAGKTVRVDINRLDVLMNLVSELIIQKTRIEDISGTNRSQQFNEAIEYLERITTNLHDAVMKVRMVSIDRVFNRFPRLIRDIAHDLNKEIELHISGEDTELDRSVIDEVGDPLIHLLRNAADHGLEDSETRISAGKEKKGKIYLSAYQEGNNVVIEVSDDGNGIDLIKVKAAAVKRGLITQEASENMSEDEIIQCLFKPNFSTTDKVTDLSGRGVGLDAVKTKIEALGGNIETQSTKGKGSKFLIQLPLTLAIIQALLVTVQSEKYAIPLGNVIRVIKIKKEDIQSVHNHKVIILQKEVIPLIWLEDILGVNVGSNEKDNHTIVVVKKGEKITGFVVDSLIGQHEIVLKSLGKYLSKTKNISGATILGDGNVALILDVNEIV